MKFDMKSLLKDKNVLRIVAVLSVLNLLGYLMMQNLDAVAFFIIIGFLTTYFSKNMIIVLLTAMVATNFLVMSRAKGKNLIEGLENKDKGKSVDEEEQEEEENDKAPASATEREEKEVMGKKPALDETKTIEAMHEHLDSLGANTKKMDEDHEDIAKKIQQAKQNMKDLAPLIEKSQKMLEGMGGIDGISNLMGKMGPLMNMMGGVSTGKKKKGGDNASVEGFSIMG